MLYRDLVQFEPIESVIQLRAADDKREAANLVKTYVVSNRMADQLANVVFPQLQIDRPLNNKGVLVVGNYGTGKSHLMSVLSALAEHEDMVHLIRNSFVRDAATSIAGRFKVARAEIGGVERNLRDIVLNELEQFFERVGTPYHFPTADQVTNNKGDIIKAMEGFTARYPNKGVLFVLDELLDYLRTREERALILDLGILRELGEVTAVTPLRFVAGLQETLFDNPRFAFVAEQLRRVRDRFEQVRIAREDIAYVVAERLLGKNDTQLAQSIEHLRSFAKLYPPMAERLNEFARLFPIHPAYIDTFERVYIAEKREVLQTFSRAIRSKLDQEVPTEETGLISYDHYWSVLTDNPSLRTLPDVADVVEKSNVLEGRIRNAYTRKQLLPMALRVIHALSVHRLTTSDIHAPLGVTAEELRDQLCLWTPMPEADAEFLAGTVQVALKEIMRTVSGQYISYNDDNGQYYLNLKKDIDFDAKVAERGNFLEERDLNRYFYSALRELLNIKTSIHVTGFLIWRDELAWAEKNVMRPGYLFFGPPNERSTAQPPLDWYIYFLPPFGERKNRWNATSDEIIFRLDGLAANFEEMVRKYAGAQAMAAESPTHRQTYQDKADHHLRALITWLRQNFNNHLRVTYEGATKTVPEALAKTRNSASKDAEDLLRVIASQFLSSHFHDTYPEYPAFPRLSQPISEQGRPTSAQEAVRLLAGRPRTNLAVAILDGLKLLGQEERIKPLDSPYARYFLDILLAKGETQVVNQGEVIEQIAGGLQPVFKETHFKLEPEWVAVILLALVYDGQITLNLRSKETLNASNIDRAALKSMDDLTDFDFYRRPKQIPLTVWTQIFEALGLPPGLIRDEARRDEAIQRLSEQVQAELKQVVEWHSKVQGGLTLWNQPLFTDRFQFSVDKDGLVVGAGVNPSAPKAVLSQSDLLPYLRKSKELLEGISRYNTPGKLRNLNMTTSDASESLAYRARALRVKELLDVIDQLQPQTAYLSEAGAILPVDHQWVDQAEAARQELLSEVRHMAKGEGNVDLIAWRNRLEELRRQYIKIYTDLHNHYVLGPRDDERKARLLRDPHVNQLKALSAVDILNAQELKRWSDAVIAIPSCRDFHEGLLDASPTCPRCHFRPSQANGHGTAVRRLDTLEDQLQEILTGWHAALRQNLQSDAARQSIRAMTADERAVIDTYLAQQDPANSALPPRLVEAVNQALRGLQTVTLHGAALLAALQKGGMPCTTEQLAERFREYVRDIMSGHDPRNTRLTIEQE